MLRNACNRCGRGRGNTQALFQQASRHVSTPFITGHFISVEYNQFGIEDMLKMGVPSDKCCAEGCPYNLGSSEAFKAKLSTITKLEKDHIEDSFKPLVGEKIFDTINQGVVRNYQDVVDGSKTVITTFPEVFSYDSRVGEKAVVVEEVLIDRLMELQQSEAADASAIEEVNDQLTRQELQEREAAAAADIKEIKDIQTFLRIIIPQTAERDIFNLVLGSLHNQPGLLLHSYKPSDYVKLFKNIATEQRRVIDIDVEVIEMLQKILQKLHQQHANEDRDVITTINSLNGSKGSNKRLKAKFQSGMVYTIEDIQNVLDAAKADLHKLNQTEAHFSFTDLEKLLLNVMGISVGDIENTVEGIMSALEEKSNREAYPAILIHEAINKNETISSHSKVAAKRKFLPGDQVVIMLQQILQDLEELNRREDPSIIDHIDTLQCKQDTKERIKAKFSHNVAYTTEQVQEVLDVAKGEAKPTPIYTKDQIRNTITRTLFDTETNFPGEMDMLIVLPRSKLILNIEVKSEVKRQTEFESNVDAETTAESEDGKNKNLNASLAKASDQLKKHSSYLARVHGDVLDDDWQFVKIAAILPGHLDHGKICDHCSKFIITSNIQTKKQMTEWLMSNGILQRRIDKKKQERQKEKGQWGYQQFLKLFLRIINYSSTSMHNTINWSWRNVQGEKSNSPDWVYTKGIGTGYTKGKGLTPAQLRFNAEMKNRPVDFHKVLFFNKVQERLLQNPILRMVLLGDYGTGKNFIHS